MCGSSPGGEPGGLDGEHGLVGAEVAGERQVAEHLAAQRVEQEDRDPVAGGAQRHDPLGDAVVVVRAAQLGGQQGHGGGR
ncbi:hypothetical protein ACFSTC_25795 [Nonomuraea ferruginea]